jgi:hypothetical protein
MFLFLVGFGGYAMSRLRLIGSPQTVETKAKNTPKTEDVGDFHTEKHVRKDDTRKGDHWSSEQLRVPGGSEAKGMAVGLLLRLHFPSLLDLRLVTTSIEFVNIREWASHLSRDSQPKLILGHASRNQ